MGFFSQLSRGANRFFGKQLPRFGQQLGRQLSIGSRDAGSFLNRGINFINKLE